MGVAVSRMNSIIRFGLLFTMVILIVIISGSVLEPLRPAYAACSPCIIFDNGQYPNSKYFFDHGMYISVKFDTDQGLHISVNITSTTDPKGILVVFDRINNVSPFTYTLPTGFVNFTSIHSSNPNVPSILASSLADRISAYVQIPSGFSNVVNTTGIQDSNYISTLGTPISPQPNLTLQLNSNCVMSSNDGICDSWKNSNGFNGLDVVYPLAPSVAANSGNVDYKYACNPSNPDPLNVCPQVGSPDIYVELDYMAGHKPDTGALLNIVNAFRAHGIRLHIQLDDDMANYHQVVTGPPTNGAPGPITNPPNFDYLKQIYFGTTQERTVGASPQFIADLLTAKRQVFHYVIFTHSQAFGASGQAETPGNDIDISLGNWTGGVGSPDDQAGTFMHELGHNLGLQHGGNDAVNCKPNYPSVMSYARQFSSLFTGVTRPLDYSSEVLPSTPAATTIGKLDKYNLNEIMGITSNKYRVSQPIIYGDTSGVPHVDNTGFRSDRLNSLWLNFANNPSDVSGNGNDGIVKGGIVTYSTSYPRGDGVAHSSVNFDGSSYIVSPSTATVTGSNDRSVSFWLKTPGSFTNGNYLFSWGTWGSNHNFFGLTTVNTANGKVLYVQGWNDDLQGSTVLLPNMPYHIVVTVSSTGSTLSLYVNGRLDATSNGHSINTASSSLFVGAASTGSIIDREYLMSDFQVWNYQLSPSDINSLYNSNQPAHNNLLWLFFKNNPSDVSGNGNDGIVTGGTVTYPISYPKLDGVAHSSVAFDGSAYIVSPSTATVTGSANRSVSFWLKTPSTFTAGTFVFSWGAESANNLFGLAWPDSGSASRLDYVNWAVADRVSATYLQSGTWYHIVATLSSGTVKNLYINGVKDANFPVTEPTQKTPSSSLYVGNAPDLARPLGRDSVLADFQVWNYQLSPSDIASLYNSNQPSGIMTVKSIDFKRDGKIALISISSTSLNYIASINDCPGTSNPLMGFDDWDNLQLNMWKFSYIRSMYD